MSISGVRNTTALVTPETRICSLIMAGAKLGKTELSSSLNAITLKYRGKKTLIIACEVAEGGGTMTLHGRDFDYYEPTNWQDMESLLAQLQTDTTYGGIVLDNASDYVERIVKPYALKFPCKEDNSKFAGTRVHGVLQRSDFGVQGEFARQQLAKLIMLTRDKMDAKFRKDLVVTALEKERRSPDGETVLGVKPNLPGALAEAVTAMFQSVLTVKKEAKVVGAGTPQAQRVDVRSVLSGGDPLRTMLGDRTGMWPLESGLTDSKGQPVGMLPLYEAWLAQMEKAAA